jgi:hypothetical protein
VKFRKTEWTPRAGDVLHVPGGRFRIERIVVDDGFVTETVLHG